MGRSQVGDSVGELHGSDLGRLLADPVEALGHCRGLRE
jgi:hypothetical protein